MFELCGWWLLFSRFLGMVGGSVLFIFEEWGRGVWSFRGLLWAGEKMVPEMFLGNRYMAGRVSDTPFGFR